MPFGVERVKETSIELAIFASIALVILVLISVLKQNTASEAQKKLLFGLMVIVVIGPTFYFVATTIQLNRISITGGPVHWHADFRIFACGEELSSPEPPRFSNKVGTTLFHEHEDRRIHIEGVVVDLEGVSLQRFFEVQGGRMTAESFDVPTRDGIVSYSNGAPCPRGTRGVWQAFLYSTEDGVVAQRKLTDYLSYVPSAHTLVPPGDCLILEYAPLKLRTDHICDFYAIEIEKGNLTLIQ